MTNLEWLRSMSMDEWARLIYRYDGDSVFCKDKPERGGDDGCPDPGTMCLECIKEWLEAEVDE